MTPQADPRPRASIGSKGQELVLEPVGTARADGDYPGGAYATLLKLDAGDLQLRRRCHIYGVPTFGGDLKAIYESLRGRAALCTTDDLEISVEGDGRGHFSIVVEAGDMAPTDYRLRANFTVDQTFIPQFIRGLETAFPDQSR